MIHEYVGKSTNGDISQSVYGFEIPLAPSMGDGFGREIKLFANHNVNDVKNVSNETTIFHRLTAQAPSVLRVRNFLLHRLWRIDIDACGESLNLNFGKILQ